ncbi:hypothetical protein J19TS2_36250 [Cohnella xylanilytica]|uniref:S-layer homology domain-containing protein n=1 Tax=Cohnella xylanilytica TaxID=557555 RepID=UPI001B26960D|nr:S-layer homology domain-containing protein [Cohnella xylanilytica]GIO14070.1 hypothetical protein J19TS2_36250 [Cohnella xylanilytica]
MNTVKRYVAAILALLFALAPVSVYAASSFALGLSAKEVLRGGAITLSGTAASDEDEVSVKIIRPNQTTFYMDVIVPTGGTYSKSVSIPTDADLAPYGEYKVVAGSGAETKTQSFSVVDGNGTNPGTDPGTNPGTDPGTNPGTDPGTNPGTDPGTNPGTDPGTNPGTDPGTNPGTDPGTNPGTDPGTNPGTNPGNGNGSGSGSNGRTVVSPPIPSGAGEASGSVVKPEQAKEGHYIVGSDTMAQAIGQANGSVTIQVPGTASGSGTALELPAKSLTDLNGKKLDLIADAGDRTIRFPAGSLAGSNDTETTVRIVLRSAWTSEAKSTVDKSLISNADYKSTGVVFSVTVQIVSGGQATDVTKLDKPALVTMKLTPEQEKLISADLAGVYYADGDKLEFVGGKLEGGLFTFTAEHLTTSSSYYTILEYNKSFGDLASHWAESSVKSLAAKHIVNGVDERHFAPNRSISRAEFASMMMRAVDWSGKAPEQEASNPFKDVPAGQYYTEQVADAASLGILSGYDGAFRPKDDITREEAVVALVRAAKYFDVSKSGQAAAAFDDAKATSSWAEAAVSEAVSLGLIQGDGARFHPKKPVTRAEMAVMIARLLPHGSR